LKRTVVLFVLPVLFAFGLVLAGERIIHERDSAFNHIIVTEDDKGVRRLLFEEYGAIQSAAKPSDPDDFILEYTKVIPLGLVLVEEPSRALVVGVGGATIPSFLHRHYPKMRIDAVDIDPEVIEVAKLFFGFKEDDLLKAHAADGRKFIEETKERYDLVYLDAFGPDSIPYALATRQFLEAVRKVLTPKGAVVGNLWSHASNPLYESMLRTYQEVFETVYLFDVSNSSNRIVIALPKKGKMEKEEMAKKARELVKAKGLRLDLGAAVDYGYHFATDLQFDGEVLLDGK
jgi:spermidine synthase